MCRLILFRALLRLKLELINIANHAEHLDVSASDSNAQMFEFKFE